MPRKLLVEIVGDASSLERTYRRAGAATRGFGRDLGGLGRAARVAAVALGGVAVVKTIKDVVSAASDMNETVSKSQVVFGQSGAAIEKWSEGLDTSLGLSKQAALDAASIFGTFGRAAGLTGDRVAQFSKPLVQAAADLASFHNVPVDQALQDIRSGLSGEVEPLRKYGILLNDATLRQEALALGLVKTTKTVLPPNIKMLAAQKLILQGLGPAAGDFARTSSSAANQQRILAAQADNLKAKLGQGLLPVWIKVLGIGNRLLPAFDRFIDSFSRADTVNEKLQVVWDALGNAGQRAFDALKTAFSSIDWGAIWDGVQFRFGRIVAKLHTVLQNADWSAVGRAIGRGISTAIHLTAEFAKRLSDQIIQAMREVDWHEANNAFWGGLLSGFPGSKKIGQAVEYVVKGDKTFYSRPFQIGKLWADFFANGLNAEAKERSRQLPAIVEHALASGEVAAANAGTNIGNAFLTDFLASVGQIGLAVQSLLVQAFAPINAAFAAIGAVQNVAAATGPGSADYAGAAHARPKPTAAPPRVVIPTPRTFNFGGGGGGGGGGAAKTWRDYFDATMERLRVELQRAQTTPGLKDDLAVLERTQRVIRQTLALHKQDVDVQRELLDVNQQIKDVKLQAVQAAQYRALGLTATGDERAPGLRALRRELARVTEGIEGTILDSKKNRGILAGVRKVLSGALGAVGRDMRLKVKEILDGIDDEVKRRGANVGHRFRIYSTRRLIEGLGLDPDTARALRARLAQIGPTGSVPAGGQLVGGDVLQVGTMYVDLHGVPDVRDFADKLHRHSKQTPHKRRGAR